MVNSDSDNTLEKEMAANENVDDKKAENDNLEEARVVENFVSIYGESLPVERRFFKYSAPLYSPDHAKSACLKDIIKEHSLPFLPAKSLSRFKTVSKEWNEWIGSEFLAHIQFIHFKDISGLLCQFNGLDPYFISFNQDAYGTKSSGLVCCQSRSGEHGYYICNPVTKELKALPKPKWFHGLEAAVALVFEPTTLGFDTSYELVCAVPVYLNQVPAVYFETYFSSTNSWKTSETICYANEVLDTIGNGLFMKGVVYRKTLMDAILAFDLMNGLYGILPLPAGTGQNGALAQMNGESVTSFLEHKMEDAQSVYTETWT